MTPMKKYSLTKSVYTSDLGLIDMEPTVLPSLNFKKFCLCVSVWWAIPEKLCTPSHRGI